MIFEKLFEKIEIMQKMDINRKRTWKKSGDGRFQHSNKE